MLSIGAEYKRYLWGSEVTDYPFFFTMTVVATVPLVLLFLRLQSYYVEGVQGFAIKG